VNCQIVNPPLSSTSAPYQPSDSPVEVRVLQSIQPTHRTLPRPKASPLSALLSCGIQNVQGRSDSRSFLLTHELNANHPHPYHQIMTLAGVAQSVERVALINSKEINLKVVGSSPTFGYSYHKAHQSSCSFAICSFWLVRCVEVDGGSMLYRGWTWLT
jgi:hypothetical protein